MLQMYQDIPETWQTHINSFLKSQKSDCHFSRFINRIPILGEGDDAVAIPIKSLNKELIRLFLSQTKCLLNNNFKQVISLLKRKIYLDLLTISDQTIQDCSFNDESTFPNTPLN